MIRIKRKLRKPGGPSGQRPEAPLPERRDKAAGSEKTAAVRLKKPRGAGSGALKRLPHKAKPLPRRIEDFGGEDREE